MVQGRRRGDSAPQVHRGGGVWPQRGNPEQELARLRVEVSQLRADKTRLSTERDILRSAAKYFAGETNW